MQKTILKNKWFKLFVVSILCSILVYIGTYATMAAIESNDTDDSVVTVVNGDGEETQYDINSMEGRTEGEYVEINNALTYVESYAENLQYDENVDANTASSRR